MALNELDIDKKKKISKDEELWPREIGNMCKENYARLLTLWCIDRSHSQRAIFRNPEYL